MKVLVACEYSGVVRDAFIARGHDAISCDLLPTESPGPHYQGDVREILGNGFDLMVAHPPCTHLAVSGARWFCHKRKDQAQALEFVAMLLNCEIPRVAVENPVSIISSKVCAPSQIIEPWWFGDPAYKRTCLWLKGLPPLFPTDPLPRPIKGSEADKRWRAIHLCPPSEDRGKIRSLTYKGIADAMAEQWGGIVQNHATEEPTLAKTFETPRDAAGPRQQTSQRAWARRVKT